MNVAPALACVLALLPFSPAQGQGVLYRGGEDPTPPLYQAPTRRPGEPFPDRPGDPAGGCGLDLSTLPTHQTDLTVWTFWWEYNRAPYLAAISRHRRLTPFGVGPGGTSAEHQWLPTHSDLFQQVQPALLQSLNGEANPDMISSALIALAKIGTDMESPDLIGLFATYLPNEGQKIARSATLALGVLGDPAAVGILTDLALDTEEGRLATDSAFVPLRMQVFAAASLGIIGAQAKDEELRRVIFATLRHLYETGTEYDRDTSVMALMSMGLVPFEGVSARAQQVDLLLGYFQDLGRCHYTRCHAAAAICRLLEGSGDQATKERALGVFLDVLASKAKRIVKTSCVIAIGKLADSDEKGIDARARAVLIAVPKTITDTQCRNLSLIALGEIAGRKGTTPSDSSTQQIAKHLEFQMRKGKNAARPWAALGAGLMIAALDTDAPVKLVETLEAKLVDEQTPRAGVYAIAAALSGRMDFEKILLAKFDLIQDDEAKGYIALALGMLGVDAVPDMFECGVDDTRYRPTARRGLVRAYGLKPDGDAHTKLLHLLKFDRSSMSQTAIAQAIGSLGDRRSIADLIEFSKSETLTKRSRACAIQALGILGGKSRAPWHALFATGFNYRASTHSLTAYYDDPGLLRFL